MKAYSTAKAPASVAVNTPLRIPPTIRIGVISARIESPSAAIISCRWNGCERPNFLRSMKKAMSTIIEMPIIRPGMKPPANRPPIETLAVNPKITNEIDGGMIGPMVEDAAVTAAEKSTSYPASRIALISILPSPPASATADPDMPAKIMLAMTLTWPRSPGTDPTMLRASRKMRSVMPA